MGGSKTFYARSSACAQAIRLHADAAEPLYSSLDGKQKQYFITEMVRLSHERGLD